MDTDFLREGIVSDVDTEKHMAKVTFPDKDDVVSAWLAVLTPYASKNKRYALPDVGEEVICLFKPNDNQSGTGFIIGSRFNEKNPPNANSQDVTQIDWADGSFMKFDRSSGKLEITCTGDIVIKGANIYLN